MGNSKKSARSSRGRSNYVKTMQRSQPRQKRIRRKEEVVDETSTKRKISPMLSGVIFGAAVGAFVGTVYSRAIIGSLIGAIIGGLGGCIVDLVQVKVLGKKKYGSEAGMTTGAV